MKKIVLVMFVVIHSYATSDTIFALQSTFKKNINEYYKLWAVGYCMGHFEVERNVKFEFQEMPARFSIDDLKISKIVYLLGVEPLNEIKDYIDKNNSYFEKDKANHCLGLQVILCKKYCGNDWHKWATTYYFMEWKQIFR